MDIEPDGNDVYIFEAIVAIKNVDWLTTIALSGNMEQEIRVKYNVAIEVVKIQNGLDEDIRINLWGNIFRA